MYEFNKWEKLFRDQNLFAFNHDPHGLLWLKVRAIRRKKQIKQFTCENGIKLNSTKIGEQYVELFNLLEKREDAMKLLNKYLKGMNHEWYAELGVDTEKLKEDLYKVQYYSWGGDHNNSLDKYYISRYVKVISNFTELQLKQSEIAGNAWNYVQNSWYNNWTSFIIESLFKQHPRIISAVGEIKSVDFFINDYPIDLKVTFFPNEFMEKKIKDALGKSVLSWLKNKCKTLGITTDKNTTESQQIYTLTEKLHEKGFFTITDELNGLRRKIIEDAQQNPDELMRWLYEKQGEMRFGAENRLFIILADCANLDQSWKMKRAFSIIEPKVKDYIENFSDSTLKPIHFTFKKRNFTALADTLFIVK